MRLKLWLAVLLLTLMGIVAQPSAVYAGVVEELQNSDVGDPDARGTGERVPPPGGAESGPGEAPAPGANGSGQTSSSSPGVNAGPLTSPSAEPTPGSKPSSGSAAMPLDRNPFTLMAVGILLLLLACAGGYYFYRHRDRDENPD